MLAEIARENATCWGLMQDWPLLVHRIIDHAAIQHGARPVVSRSVEGPIHRTTYAEVRRRALQVAKRLEKDGIGLGDRVATLAWNTWRHFEAWYGIAGIGAIYHTVNPRLFEDQIAYIMNHAEDRILLLDLTFVPLMEKLQDRLPTIERFVVLTDAGHMPQTRLRNAVAYEDWIAEVDEDFAWASFDENTGCGHVLHLGHHRRSEGRAVFAPLNVLHSLIGLSPDFLGISARDVAMPVVPLFHCQRLVSSRSRRPCAAPAWCCRARSSTAPRSSSCSTGEKVTITAGGADPWFGCCSISKPRARLLPNSAGW
jgi:fatty-acyl-CoA synthase